MLRSSEVGQVAAGGTVQGVTRAVAEVSWRADDHGRVISNQNDVTTGHRK